MTLEEVKALTPDQARLLYRAYSDDMWAAGWMGGGIDEPPFDGFVQWLMATQETPEDEGRDYEWEFCRAWEEWCKS